MDILRDATRSRLINENVRVGLSNRDAHVMADQYIEARDACPWRGPIEDWDEDRRLAWGLRAGELQDSGIGWREAESGAFREVLSGKCRVASVVPEPVEPGPSKPAPRRKRRVV